MTPPPPSSIPPQYADILDQIRTALASNGDDADPELIAELLQHVPDEAIFSLIKELPGAPNANLPPTPLAQAMELEPTYRDRPHLHYLSDRLAAAIADVEAGTSRFIRVSMPPRAGKSTLTSLYFPTWVLRKHPNWKVGVISYGLNFATTWGRSVRRLFETRDLGPTLASDAKAASAWETTEHGAMYSRGVGSEVTGIGFKVLLLDDLVKGFAEAHSPILRELIWNRWTNDIFTRLEAPFLVVAIGTRWHQDDFLGRLASDEYSGNPADWETIEFPALAETGTGTADVLGRAEGEPLLTPLIDETPAQALQRWAEVKATVGSYAWSALYQQHPAPSKGAIFDVSTFRYWTTSPSNATDDGKIVYLDPDDVTAQGGARWLDSWDCAFKAKTESDWVVGQRWMRYKANRYLIAQLRSRWTFTQTLQQMKLWASTDPLIAPPYNAHVHQRLIEDKANGPAILDTLHDEIAGLKPINPHTSKEARARSITPEIESGNVYLPYPNDPGNAWVEDLTSELREFPHGAHDDQVDALTQALTELRDAQIGSITVPGRRSSPLTATGGINRDIAAAAHTDLNRRRANPLDPRATPDSARRPAAANPYPFRVLRGGRSA